MKKILHLNNYISQTSGVTRYIYHIIKNTKDIFEHEIICLGGDAIECFRNLDINVKVIKGKSVLSVPNIYLTLLNYTKRKKIDIIHNHHRLFDSITSFLPNRNFKTITTVHSKVFGKKFLSYRSDELISYCNAITNHLLNYFKRSYNKIHQLKSFVDNADVIIRIQKEKLIEQLEIKENKLIVFIGRFSREKGVDILIHAFDELSTSNKAVSLLMIGEGEEENFLRRFITKNKLSVKILNPQKNIYDYYNIADVIVLPSRVDPFPFVMLETGLMKKPFIGSNVDGIPELIKHKVNGVLFKNESVNELVNSLSIILEEKIFAQEIANNLYKDVIESYTAEKVIPEYVALYNSII
jgi:glycosyltransferase involved in cell wall biosynthesis